MYKNFNYDLFKLLRPLPNSIKREKTGIPIIKKLVMDGVDDSSFTTFTNIKSCSNKDKTIVTMFEYDKSLKRVWNDPYKYIPKFADYKAICTPDFSVYGQMDRMTIAYSTYMNRWLGCFYQAQGLKVIPTISWAFEDTYDICFSAVEPGSIVCISTIGCMKSKEIFLKGYNEMIKRLQPSLIIIKGQFIPGMTGNYLIVPFESTFNLKQKEVKSYGRKTR